MSDPQVQFVPCHLQDPATTTPERRPGSVRRTVSVDVVRPGRTSRDGLRVDGAVRDLSTAKDASQHPSTFSMSLAGDRTLLSITSSTDDLRGLVGVSVLRGFRASLATTLPDVGRPMLAVLDEVPSAVLVGSFTDAFVEAQRISGAWLRSDICAGWVTGGVLLDAIERQGVVPVSIGPAAPCIDDEDPDGWHELAELPTLAFRRQRLVDVSPTSGSGSTAWLVQAMFRDTYVVPDDLLADGTVERTTLRVLHEYELRAELDDDLVVRSCTARPRVLPWPECPSAAASSAQVVGRSVASLGPSTRQEVTGVSSCTHLTDLLASLGWVPDLLGRAGTGSVTIRR